MEVRDVPDPQITAPDDVLLKIDTVGVCGSDVHYYTTGRIGSLVVEYPCMTGHECAATVVEAGPEAAGLSPGRRIAVDPLIACGRCDQCLSGRRHTCRNQGFLACPGQGPGAIAEYLVMPAGNCYPIPDNIDNDEAAIIEPLSIGLYAQRLAGEVVGKRIAVLGTGPIGLSVLACLQAAGAAGMFATDLLGERLAVAQKFGAAWTASPRERDVVADMLEQASLGMDLVFECAGEQETLDQGIELLTPGGTLLVLGIPETERVSFLPDLLRRKEIRIQNVRRQNDCVQPAIDLMASGKLDVKAMVTHHFPMDRTKEAFDMVADYCDGVIKAIIDVSQA